MNNMRYSCSFENKFKFKKTKTCIYFKSTNSGGRKYSVFDVFENVYGRSQEILNNCILLALFIVKRRKNMKLKRKTQNNSSMMKIFQ